MDTTDLQAPASPSHLVAAQMHSLREPIFSRWEEYVRSSIPETRELSKDALVNGLGKFYDDLVIALGSNSSYTPPAPGSGTSFSHGRERATLTQYGHSDLVKELQLLRQVIFETADFNGLCLQSIHRALICRSIDIATLDAINSFAVAQKEIAETFITSLSHDLRNPLNIANVSAQLIERKSDDQYVKGQAQRIRKKLGDLDAMIQTLLDAAFLKGRKRLRLKIAQFDMKDLVSEIGVDMATSSRPILVVGDSVLGHWCMSSLKRVFENLLSNAQKYGAPNTPIEVQIFTFARNLIIEVQNEGPPIPVEDRHLLFSTFHRFEQVKVKGWGLGLPFVRLVVESHGGSISVVSTKEKGTTFTINLPIDCRANESKCCD